MGEVVLPDGLRFTDVETGAQGSNDEERSMTLFVPQGYATPTWIHLTDDDDNQYTLIINPLTGTTEIRDGRIAMER